VKALRIGFS